MTQAAKWLTLAIAILVVGAVAIVAIIRFTGEDATSGIGDTARAKADSAIIAYLVGSALDSKVRVTSIKPMGDQLWRVAMQTPTPSTYCVILDTRQFRASGAGKIESGASRVSCAFGR
jgi:hypothetical protein